MRPWMVLVLVGCWTGAPPVDRPEPPQEPATTVRFRKRPRPPSPCETAIDRAIEAFRAEIDGNQQRLERLEVLRTAAIASCTTTGWTTETLDCFETAVDATGVQGCLTRLSSEQLRDLRDRMSAAMQPTP